MGKRGISTNNNNKLYIVSEIQSVLMRKAIISYR